MKKPWVTADVLERCDKRRKLKKKKGDVEGAQHYRAVNQQVKKSMKREKKNWNEQCQNIEENLNIINNKKAYQLVNNLTSTKQGRATTIQDKAGIISDGRIGHTTTMDRVLLRVVQLQS